MMYATKWHMAQFVLYNYTIYRDSLIKAFVDRGVDPVTFKEFLATTTWLYNPDSDKDGDIWWKQNDVLDALLQHNYCDKSSYINVKESTIKYTVHLYDTQ